MKYAHLLDQSNKVTQISVLGDDDVAQDCIDAYGVMTIVRSYAAGIGHTYDPVRDEFIAPVVPFVATVVEVGGGTL